MHSFMTLKKISLVCQSLLTQGIAFGVNETFIANTDCNAILGFCCEQQLGQISYWLKQNRRNFRHIWRVNYLGGAINLSSSHAN